MLHHMPSPALQDRLFAEVFRVLRPGGAFVGTDSLDSKATRAFHADDVFVPVDPETLGARLDAAGFVRARVELASYELRFSASKP
jgi:predicted methyltransferase